MGDCLSCFPNSNDIKTLPIETIFKLPSSMPSWPPGEGFASGTIDLGGLQVCQISTFTKIWAINKGGPNNLGASFFEPSSVPDGFFMLGCYSQSNNNPLHGWLLVGKDINGDPSGGTLSKPLDYTLVWNSESLKIDQNDHGYIWLPTPPDGYKPVGHVVTTSPEKPSLEKVRCVRADLTEECELSKWIWGEGTISDTKGFNVSGLRPRNRGTKAQGVCVGTFLAQNSGDDNSTLSQISCLKNNNFVTLSPMPNLAQVEAIVQAYSPWIYFHPRETYLPSSVSWYFDNGAQLYEKGKESKPVPIEHTGSNLPQGGSNDDTYWIDLPMEENTRDKVKRGDLQSTTVYLHIKPMLGATFTDIPIWIFYPFNGPSTAKIGLIDIPLGKIGEHVGDWEHTTLRVSNFDGMLYSVYFAEHSGGTWVDTSLLEFKNGSNKFVAYSSLHGHATYAKPGLVLQGTVVAGIRNDTAKSDMFIDMAADYSIVAAEYIAGIVEPPWLNYARKWGPKITYEIGVEVEKLEKSLPEDLKSGLESLVNLLPDEVYGEDGPTGPKVKSDWNGDER